MRHLLSFPFLPFPFFFISFNLIMHLFTFTFIFSVLSDVFATPLATSTAVQSMSLRKRSPLHRTEEEWALWAKNQRDILITKYGGAPSLQKRSSGTSLCVIPLFYLSFVMPYSSYDSSESQIKMLTRITSVRWRLAHHPPRLM